MDTGSGAAPGVQAHASRDRSQCSTLSEHGHDDMTVWRSCYGGRSTVNSDRDRIELDYFRGVASSRTAIASTSTKLDAFPVRWITGSIIEIEGIVRSADAIAQLPHWVISTAFHFRANCCQGISRRQSHHPGHFVILCLRNLFGWAGILIFSARSCARKPRQCRRSQVSLLPKP